VLPPAIEGAIDPHIRQTDVSAVWPLGANWKILGRWNYDHSNARNLESFGGVEYGNCCVKIRVVAREWINENELFVRNFEPNRGVFLQFTLLGLGDLSGGGLDRLLTEGIQGYDSRSLR
jgi:LPS-assembly protein